MGNSLGCSASGERLVSAARDGDLTEARMLLEFNPSLAKYSTFGGLNSPLHFAAAKGHNDMVTLLLENGADVNSRNYCGQTALMQACRHGHWEVVQTLLLYRCNVTRADYLSGRTALHFAAVDGHVRCIRLLVTDFVPSAPYPTTTPFLEVGNRDGCSNLDSSLGHKYDHSALAKFISKSADGGITALHIAALNGYADSVHLLLDLHANVAAVTFHYGSSMNLIGAGSTALHYAACGGNLRCCQVLLSRGSSRLTLNCNGWLPVDVARIWGRHALEPLLAPNSDVNIPVFPPSNYLSLPLMSILNIAREWGLQSLMICDDTDVCPVCIERCCNVVSEGCLHEFCVKCALYLCSTSRSSWTSSSSSSSGPAGSIPCPLCRSGIVSFSRLPTNPIKELKPGLRFCNPCLFHHPTSIGSSSCSSTSDKQTEMDDPADDLICPLTCSPFLVVEGQSPPPRLVNESDMLFDDDDDDDDDRDERRRLERSSCSGRMFWTRRSYHREHQCNSEINA